MRDIEKAFKLTVIMEAMLLLVLMCCFRDDLNHGMVTKFNQYPRIGNTRILLTLLIISRVHSKTASNIFGTCSVTFL